MSEKNFLSWVGFKGEDEKQVSPGASSLERIRELENQLADLKSRKDISTLSQEEFEILATETAITIIKSAQAREAKASAQAEKVINESNRSAKQTLEAAESKARSILAGAEARGRKYIEVAESEAAATRAAAVRESEELLATKRREAQAVTSAAKRDADQMVANAIATVAEYRSWLATAISESERLYRIQSQSLQSAEQAIAASKDKLTGAFEKLAALQDDIASNVDQENRPIVKSFTSSKVVAEAPAVEIQSTLRDVKSIDSATARKRSATSADAKSQKRPPVRRK